MKTYRLAGPVVTNEEAMFYEMFETDCISAKAVHKMLADSNGDDVTFNLNSVGGSVFDGNEIYTMLKNYSGRVIVNITGLAASIASVIMLGADEINISKAAHVMIHKVSAFSVGGDSDSIQRTLNRVTASEKAIAELYASRTGIATDEILKMMFEETWFTADEAVEKGFADHVIAEQDIGSIGLVASYDETLAEFNDFQEVINLLKSQMKGINMSKNKSLKDKIKALLTDSAENATDNAVEQEEVAVDETVTETETSPEQAENTSDDGVEKEEVAEETSENDELIAALEKASAEIERLRAENKNKDQQIEQRDKRINELQDKNNSLENRQKKSESVLNKLNALLEDDSEDSKMAVVNTAEQSTQKEHGFTPRFGHKKD